MPPGVCFKPCQSPAYFMELASWTDSLQQRRKRWLKVSSPCSHLHYDTLQHPHPQTACFNPLMLRDIVSTTHTVSVLQSNSGRVIFSMLQPGLNHMQNNTKQYTVRPSPSAKPHLGIIPCQNDFQLGN